MYTLLILLFSILVPDAKALPDFKRNPVVYGISPYFLSSGQGIKGLTAVTKRLPELKELGINIIWLQPITPSLEGDHGYDVIDYKSISPALGTSADFKKLVKTAHELGIKVMLDMVLNHSSDAHPFVLDIQKKGKESDYYNFYQHAPIPNIPYAEHFQVRELGETNFIHYFWPHLLNFNFNHPPLRAYLFEVLSYWVKQYNIDGYRFDASWGPSTRWPLFYKKVSIHLRKIRPDIILMAEDQAGRANTYGDSGFDWAYDWNNKDPNWISKWSFQTGEGMDETIFNEKDPKLAADNFIRAVRYGDGDKSMKTVRYIENNDTPGFLRYHTLKETKFAATIMFMLPGVPLVFYGQETGNDHDTFELPAFDPTKKMSHFNPKLWSFYQKLIKMRRSSPLLSEGKMEKLKRESPTEVSFIRSLGQEKIKIVVDFKLKKVTTDRKVHIDR